jgi:hypothetical protein
MPGKGNPMGHGKGGGSKPAGQDETSGGDGRHGRAGSSPGHLKREAGAPSARGFAPGRAGKASGGTALPERAPEDMAED